ncbi:MAG: hypothetical protein QM608_10155 [Caulobacter sp.]
MKMRLLGMLVVGAVLSLGRTASADEDHDQWRYVAAKGKAPARAEMVKGGEAIFTAWCPAPGALTMAFSTAGSEAPDPRKWAPGSYLDLDIVLYDPKTGQEDRVVMKGEPRRRSVVGRLSLTPELARRIVDSPGIALYGDNGPSNDYHGGEARALRRLLKECASV